jgi:hypothetical protein
MIAQSNLNYAPNCISTLHNGLQDTLRLALKCFRRHRYKILANDGLNAGQKWN